MVIRFRMCSVNDLLPRREHSQLLINRTRSSIEKFLFFFCFFGPFQSAFVDGSRTPTNISRLIPIVIKRLQSLSNTVTGDEYLLDSATTEYYTQADVAFSLIAATIPCLRLFMEAAKTGLLGISMWGPGTTSGSYTRSYAGKESKIKSSTRSIVTKGRENREGV